MFNTASKNFRGGFRKMLQVTPVRAFADNYIWLIHAPRAATQVVAVDPGDAAPVERALAEKQLTLAGMAEVLSQHGAVRLRVKGRDSVALDAGELPSESEWAAAGADRLAVSVDPMPFRPRMKQAEEQALVPVPSEE